MHRARLKLSKTDVAVQVSFIVMCFVNSHLKPQFFRCHNELGIDQVQHPGADHMDFKLEDNGAATNFQMYMYFSICAWNQT